MSIMGLIEPTSGGVTGGEILFEGHDLLKMSKGEEDVAFTLTLLHDPAYAGVTDITEAQVVGGLDYKEGNAESSI